MSEMNAASEMVVEVPAGAPVDAAVPAATTTPATPTAPVVVQSPPAPRVLAADAADPRAELARLAEEVAKRGTRKLLWDYLRLRGRVMGK